MPSFCRLKRSSSLGLGPSVGAGVQLFGSGATCVGSGPAQGKTAAETRSEVSMAGIEYWNIVEGVQCVP